MTKILIKTLVVAYAIHAIGSTNAYAQAPKDSLSQQDVRDSLFELSISINKLTERLEQDSSYLEDASKRQQRLEASTTSIRRELDRLSERLTELANETNTVTEDLNKSNEAAITRHSEIIALINDANGQTSKLRADASDLKQTIDLNVARLEQLDEQFARRSSNVDAQVGEVEKSVEDGFVSIKSDVLFRTLAVTVLFLIFAVVLILIRRQFSSRHQVLSAEVTDSSAALQNEYNNLDVKLSELLSKELRSIGDNPDKDDHTLPLEVATEVHRMRKRIARMPEDIKGIKPLEKALERLTDSLDSKGYKIVELVGEKYVEGLNVNPRFIVDENREPDMQVITNVIKPQVNYEDKIIQVADVEVSVGE